jgi:uncharacterized protein YjbJ (UPF0337 family)
VLGSSGRGRDRSAELQQPTSERDRTDREPSAAPPLAWVSGLLAEVCLFRWAGSRSVSASTEENAMRARSIDRNQLRGVSDKAVGVAKELFGVLVGSDRWQREGEAQQERAAAELKALRDEVNAEKLDAKAEGFEVEQRAAQRGKAS